MRSDALGLETFGCDGVTGFSATSSLGGGGEEAGAFGEGVASDVEGW